MLAKTTPGKHFYTTRIQVIPVRCDSVADIRFNHTDKDRKKIEKFVHDLL